MYEVEVDEAVRDRRDLRSEQLQRELGQRFGLIKEGEIPTREQLQQTAARVKVIPEGERRIIFQFKEAADADKLDRELLARYGDIREVSREGTRLELDIRTEFLDQIRETAVEQS